MAFLLLDCREAFYGGAAGGGKLAPIDTRIITPFGHSTMGDMKVGSQVSNPDGTTAKVIAVHPQGEVDIYRVTFSDGVSTEVGLDHLWLVWFSGARRKAEKKYLLDNDDIQDVKGRIVTTRWLIDYIERQKVNNRNYAPLIPLTFPVSYTVSSKYSQKNEIHPYLLGVLLGDGCLTKLNNSINYTSLDPEIGKRLEEFGYHIKRQKEEKTWTVYDVGYSLEKLGLIGCNSSTKFIPREYKYGSVEERIQLISGMMDTDGYVDVRGHMSYCSISKTLAEDFREIIFSLGGKATITDRTPEYVYNGEKLKGQKAYTVYFNTKINPDLVYLPRKKQYTSYDYNGGCSEVSRRMDRIEYSRRYEAACITVDHPNGLYMQDDFIVTHNSYALLAAALQFIDVPQYNALILRDSFANLSKPEGLIDVSFQWLSNTDAKWKDSTKTWLFPSGATLSFGHLDGPKSHYQYLSAAYQFVGIDEVVAIPEHQALYLFSRQRRTKGMMNVPIRFRCASNPPGREQLETGAWVKERYVDPRTRKPGAIFIPAKMDDNPSLDTDEYRIALSNLPLVTRKQLEDGDWDVSAKGRLFDRAWFASTMVDIPPDKVLKRIRFWDLAATEPSKKVRDPDYTVGIKMSVTSSGIYYIEHMVRFRKSPAMTEATIQQQAELDGRRVEIWIEQESGAAGKMTIDNFQRNILRGFAVRGESIRGKKAVALDRVAPVSSAAEVGLIYIVRGSWNEAFYEELEVFPDGSHDDIASALTGAFTKLAASGSIPRLGFF